MSQDQNAGQTHNIKTNHIPFERVEGFLYLGTTLTEQNPIHEKLNSRLKPWNACYHLVQNLLSSSLLSKHIKIRLNKSINLPVVLYGCETWLLTREERRLRVSHNKVLRRIFGPKRDKVKGRGENYIMRSLMICNPHQILCWWSKQ
jgi:hypothetical protein